MRRIFFLLILIMTATGAIAQSQYKDARILFILDGSENMLLRFGNEDSKFKAAEKIMLSFIDSVYLVNDQVEFALHVYGHQYLSVQNNCYDNKLEVAFSKNNLAQMGLRLASLKPKGMEAMKSAMQTALANDFATQNLYNYTFIVITSGEDNCEEGICTLSQAIQNKNLKCSPTVINLSERQVQYGCIGEQITIKDGDDIPGTVSHLLSKYKTLIEPRDKSYKSVYGTIGARPAETMTPDAPVKIAPMPVHTYGLLPTAVYPPNVEKLIVPEHEQASNGFGYLKVIENVAGNDFQLYYQQGASFVLFDKLSIRSLSTGQQVLLKAGNYKLVYTVPAKPNPFSKAKFVSIRNKMVTEIKLN